MENKRVSVVQELLPLFDAPPALGGRDASVTSDPDVSSSLGWPKRLVSGRNDVAGVPVEVVRRRCRAINIRIGADGLVRLTVPVRWATLGQGEEFLRAKWDWVLKTRTKVLSRPHVPRTPLTAGELESLATLLEELNALWSARVGEPGVRWKIRNVKSVWGVCHWRDRYITYNSELARAPRELVEYVVAHEYTHFAVHGHGPRFYALMDERLPGWKALRKRLNRRGWESHP